MTSMITPSFIVRSVAGIGLALFGSIAWGLGYGLHVLPLVCALFGWGFSLANSLFAVVLLHYSCRPPLAIAITAVTLIFYPVIQYQLAKNGSDGEAALGLCRIIIGAYLISGVVTLISIYFAAEASVSRTRI